MFETSETTQKLDEQLAKVQADLTDAMKDGENGHFNSTYATLTSVWHVARPALTKYNVNLTQWPLETTEGKVRLLTRIGYQGEWMRAVFTLPVMKQDPHGHGSGITYAKRFCLAAILGVATEDDDGNHASEKGSYGSSHTGHTAPPKPVVQAPHPKVAQSSIPAPAPIKQAVNKARDAALPPIEAKALIGWDQPLPDSAKYVIPFGKFKGKPMHSVPLIEARGYAHWLNEQNLKDGKEMKYATAEYIAAVGDYELKSTMIGIAQPPAPPPGMFDDDIPVFDHELSDANLPF